jgi:hypothetical protein
MQKICVLLFSVVLLSINATAQDLYDLTHTRAYAAHLMRSRQFVLAAEEYERLAFMQPANDTFKVQLLRAYRLGQQHQRGQTTWQAWQTATLTPSASQWVNGEYANLLLTNHQHRDAIVFAALPHCLNVEKQHKTQLYGAILEQDWTSSRLQLDNWPTGISLPQRAALTELTTRGSMLRYKKPWLAASMSAVVPGLGKVYSKDWKDGAISLLFVGLNTWQSYRRFDKQGIRSPMGWVHGGMALGFYLGNIYGSHKSARMYNDRLRHKLHHESEQLIFPTLD